jgi:hypothetical protein
MVAAMSTKNDPLFLYFITYSTSGLENGRGVGGENQRTPRVPDPLYIDY